MQARLIQIYGRVQGVGFRPYVYKTAALFNLNGWVCNDLKGLRIHVEGSQKDIGDFLHSITAHPPRAAHILDYTVHKIPIQFFASFEIKQSSDSGVNELLITPDFSICPSCISDMSEAKSRRYRYPFTNCVDCGPRYSIIKDLPYDRINTAMAHFDLCPKCEHEYINANDRRFHAQTNTCPECPIKLSLYDRSGMLLNTDSASILKTVHSELKKGRIIAVKGIGGFLLLCDARNSRAVSELRYRKQRSDKPFALLYPNEIQLRRDIDLDDASLELLKSSAGPIALLSPLGNPYHKLALDQIAPGLSKLGVMMPSAPLLMLISRDFNAPLVATSGNISGYPIAYKNDAAFEMLNHVADLFVMHSREIVNPQDDSVVLPVDESKDPILIRRSRGYAPSFLAGPVLKSKIINGDRQFMAMGADLKSAFGLNSSGLIYVSQYLGNLNDYTTELNFKHTLKHLTGLLKFSPTDILVDAHPTYVSTSIGREMSLKNDLPIHTVQHHKAHFAAILGEHDLLDNERRIIGFILDGTGYGDDGQIWGGEVFMYESGQINRLLHIPYVRNLGGDKMATDARLPLLAYLNRFGLEKELIINDFERNEWRNYNRLLEQKGLLSSSAGRLFDAVAYLLKLGKTNGYEGELAMKLEACARNCPIDYNKLSPYSTKAGFDMESIFKGMLKDINLGMKSSEIALKFHLSLANIMKAILKEYSVKDVAFSGGVFQNALLVEMLCNLLSEEFNLYFHRQLSPNDECIAFGQLVYQLIKADRNIADEKLKNEANVFGYTR